MSCLLRTMHFFETTGDTSFGSAMTSLDTGMDLHLLPNAPPVLVRGWCVCLSADYPAAGLCSGFKRSVSAPAFCRECYVDQTDEKNYPAPNSFMADNADLSCVECLRDHKERESDYDKFRRLPTQKQRADYLSEVGVNTFHAHAFTRVPYFDITKDIPYDFMHVELEGIPISTY